MFWNVEAGVLVVNPHTWGEHYITKVGISDQLGINLNACAGTISPTMNDWEGIGSESVTPLEQLTYNCNNVFTYLAVASMDEVIQGLSSSLKIKFSNSCVCVCQCVCVLLYRIIIKMAGCHKDCVLQRRNPRKKWRGAHKNCLRQLALTESVHICTSDFTCEII